MKQLITEHDKTTTAFDIMMKHAGTPGANAIIGIRYESTEIFQGVTEVLCYGTAVIVEAQRKK